MASRPDLHVVVYIPQTRVQAILDADPRSELKEEAVVPFDIFEHAAAELEDAVA